VIATRTRARSAAGQAASRPVALGTGAQGWRLAADARRLPRGTKSPNLATAERIVRAAGFELDIVPRPDLREVAVGRGHPVYVPARLPRLPVDRALRCVRLPLHLNWSEPDREYDLTDRRQRARVYEILLREGTALDISDYIDGALLVDLWPDLVIPAQLRRAWQPLIDAVRTNAAA
jgi:hypothetical protein